MNFTGPCYVAILFLTECTELIVLQNTTEYQEILKCGYLVTSRGKKSPRFCFYEKPMLWDLSLPH